MTYRIVQWGTGLVGSEAARKVIRHSQFELVGCFAHSKTKVGQDAGTLIGVQPIGVTATDRIEEIKALKPDCVLYMPLVWNVDDMASLLAAGINIVSTAGFITGRSLGTDAVKKLEDAAVRGGVSLYGTGINPGLANILGLVLSANCATVNKITVRESVDATKYASKDTWVSLGFGGPVDAPGISERIRERCLVFIDGVEMMAAALKVEIDDIGFNVEFSTANEDLDLGYMQIGKGMICGLRMTFSGIVGDKSVIDLQMHWRLGYSMTPDWPAEGYVAIIDGSPGIRASFEVTGDNTNGGDVTAMNAVHAIPAVCAARPGIVTAAELPLIVAAHCVEPL